MPKSIIKLLDFDKTPTSFKIGPCYSGDIFIIEIQTKRNQRKKKHWVYRFSNQNTSALRLYFFLPLMYPHNFSFSLEFRYKVPWIPFEDYAHFSPCNVHLLAGVEDDMRALLSSGCSLIITELPEDVRILKSTAVTTMYFNSNKVAEWRYSSPFPVNQNKRSA